MNAIALLPTGLVALVLASVTVAQDPPPPSYDEFMRVVHHERAATGPSRRVIQASVRTLEHRETGVELVLLSMQHYASAAYYAGLEPYVVSADLVVSEGWDVSQEEIDAARVRLPAFDWSRRLYEARVRLGGLVKQAEWESSLDVKAHEYVDLTFEQALAYWETVEVVDGDVKYLESLESRTRDDTPQVEVARARLHVLTSIFEDVTKARDLGADTYTEMGESPRNRAILDGIRERVQSKRHRRIVAVYGAFHAFALWPGLLAMGFEEQSTRWVDVMYLEDPLEDPSPSPHTPHRDREAKVP